jgi:signal transduction histidine kinase/DNA-binding NarL/FixJ family response regulator
VGPDSICSLDENDLLAQDFTTPELTLDSPIGQLDMSDWSVRACELAQRVAQIFAQDTELPGLLVFGGRRECDVISRREFYEKLARDFGNTPFLTVPVSRVLAVDHPEPMLLPAAMPIHEAGRRVLDRPARIAYEPIIVQAGDTDRLLDPYVLLRAQARLIASANEEIRARQEKAEQAVKAKTAFVANVSHEVRTPLNGIIGYTESILQTTSLRAAQERARTILSESEHLMGLINDLLDHAKMEAGKLELEYIPLSPRELVDCVMSSASLEVQDKPVQLSVEVDSDVPEAFLGDPTRLREILLNLVSNAVKFTDEGWVSVRVEAVETRSEWATVRFVVADTGIGIPPEKQEIIFEKFSQADGSTTRKYGGTGLGMSICRHLVELMGGTIDLTSEIDVGSEFAFTVDVEPCEPPCSPETDQPDPQQTGQPCDRATDPKRILVVEDYPTNREILRMHLERLGHEMTLVEDGLEAVEACREDTYDLIFMDIQMPRMDGLEATRRIRRELEGYSEVPILALTANAEMDTHLACLDAGMNDMITKPVRRNALLTAVTAWTSASASVDEMAFMKTTPAPDDPAPQDAPPMDMEMAVAEFGGDRAMVESVLDGFLEQLKIQAAALDAAVASGDAHTLRAEAHRIKGGAANLTALSLSAAAAWLEDIAIAGDLTHAGEAMNKFRREWERLCDYLEG